MKKKLLAILLIATALLTACGYIVVEDHEVQSIGSLILPRAHAEDEAENRSLPVMAGEKAERGAPVTEEALSEFRDAQNEEEELLYKRGAKGEAILGLQNMLREYGFLNGKADGVFGPATENAVKQAQLYRHEAELKKAEKARKSLLEALNLAKEKALVRLSALSAPEEENRAEKDGIRILGVSAKVPEIRKPKEFKADGVVDRALHSFLENEFNVYSGDLSKGAKGSDVKRLQTRLNSMYYLFGGIDGHYGSNTLAAVKYFQRLNGLKETGIADEETQSVLFSEKCRLSDYPMYRYKVEISVSKQKVYVYEWNYGAYSKLVKTMKCTTGAVETPTPLGSFKMGGPCGRWYYFKKFDCWAQYASRINGGILFHSVLYSEKDEATLRTGSVSALGTRGSHGCVRLTVEDAKWIYNNIPAGTTCRVYN